MSTIATATKADSIVVAAVELVRLETLATATVMVILVTATALAGLMFATALSPLRNLV